MKLYKFRKLGDDKDLERLKCIILTGEFHCCDFLNFNDMNEGVSLASKQDRNAFLSKKTEYKICSFSSKHSLNNQLMWGHYANAGMGVAIEIDVGLKKDLKNKKIKQVNYSNEYSGLNSIEDILTHKSKKWSYENEFRYLSKETGNKAEIEKITKIYFGMPYARLGNYDDIEKKHEKLKKYLQGEEVLKEFCKGKSIPCEDYFFQIKKRVVSIK